MSTYRLLSLAAFVLASGTEDDQVVQFRKSIGRLQKVFMENKHALSLAEVALNLNSSTNGSSISSKMDAQDSEKLDHLSVGQRVRCRDVKVERIWKSGIVTATSPTECKPDGWSSGYVFAEIETFNKKAASPGKVARMAMTSSALQLVANVDDDGEDDRLERLRRTHRNDENYDTVPPWQECDITVRGGEGNIDPLKTLDKLKECTERLRKEVKDTVDAHQSSTRANSQYVGKFKEAIQLLQKLSDVQTMRVAFAADHEKVRSYLTSKADTLESGVNKLAAE